MLEEASLFAPALTSVWLYPFPVYARRNTSGKTEIERYRAYQKSWYQGGQVESTISYAFILSTGKMSMGLGSKLLGEKKISKQTSPKAWLAHSRPCMIMNRKRITLWIAKEQVCARNLSWTASSLYKQQVRAKIYQKWMNGNSAEYYGFFCTKPRWPLAM